MYLGSWGGLLCDDNTFTGASVLTGLIYGRFSLPTNCIMFSKYAVVTDHEGQLSLMFRIANQRQGMIKDCEVQLFATIRNGNWTTVKELPLKKSLQHSLGRFPWTLMHSIDEESPFNRATWDEVCRGLDMLFIHVKGVDVIVNAQLYAEHTYGMESVLVNHALTDQVSSKTITMPDGRQERHQVVNFKNFHKVEARVCERFSEEAVFGGVGMVASNAPEQEV
jgi:inward rectifier potassium channel